MYIAFIYTVVKWDSLLADVLLLHVSVRHCMQIMWERLYKSGSSLLAGTLMQLHNLINRRNISAKMKVDM